MIHDEMGAIPEDVNVKAEEEEEEEEQEEDEAEASLKEAAEDVATELVRAKRLHLIHISVS
jgi:hypothetical protein